MFEQSGPTPKRHRAGKIPADTNRPAQWLTQKETFHKEPLRALEDERSKPCALLEPCIISDEDGGGAAGVVGDGSSARAMLGSSKAWSHGQGQDDEQHTLHSSQSLKRLMTVLFNDLGVARPNDIKSCQVSPPAHY